MLTIKQKEFMKRVIDLARKHAPTYSLDWRLMAAAAILESGWGESHLAHNANNLFGIKAIGSTPDKQTYLLRTPAGTERFRLYANDEEGFQAYGRLLSRSSHYANARKITRNTALDCFVKNIAPVYCPNDPDYRTKIMQITEMIAREKE